MFFFGIAIVFGIFAITMFSMANTVGKAKKLAEQKAAVIQATGKKADELGERLRGVALERQRNGYIPDPKTEFERTLLIDGIAMKMKKQGMEMPESLRTLFGYMTVEELKEIGQLAK